MQVVSGERAPRFREGEEVFLILSEEGPGEGALEGRWRGYVPEIKTRKPGENRRGVKENLLVEKGGARVAINYEPKV